MQKTSAIWDSIVSGTYTTEVRLLMAGNPVAEDDLFTVKTGLHVFPDNSPTAGNAVCGQLEAELVLPDFEIPRMAEVILQTRIYNGTQTSEWLDQGHFFIDTRSRDRMKGLNTLRLTCYDSMLKAEADCPAFNIDYPATDLQMVKHIAEAMGVTVDPRTLKIIKNGYLVQFPDGYSEREVLSGIAAMYGGTFIMSPAGQLRLVSINDIPAQTHYLVTQRGAAITFGGVRILV